MLPTTLGEAIISVISKPTKDSMNCFNYTPTSLINVDTKILVKTLSHQLEQVLPKSFHKSQ